MKKSGLSSDPACTEGAPVMLASKTNTNTHLALRSIPALPS
jgi:hypothetical protein